MPKDPAPLQDAIGARPLAQLGDSVTTDHISPAGNIEVDLAHSVNLALERPSQAARLNRTRAVAVLVLGRVETMGGSRRCHGLPS